MLRTLKTTAVSLQLLNGLVQGDCTSPPSAKVKNGTLLGKYVASYNQDLFLGVPFAQPPVGNLRLQNPQSLNATFEVRNATEYADSCIGYGNSPAWPYKLGEDCLTLNVVRPSRVSQNDKLPVGVFIHGGGWTSDYSANGVYNLSFIVAESVKINKPIIAISVDYRLSAWGFLASQEILDAGLANLGLKDQRLALRYINENIAAFGGDPAKVVIWGESAGGGNVGYHATAYGGRDDGLFRGLISESGAEGTQLKNLARPTFNFNNITRSVGCGTAANKIACLRTIPVEKLNSTIAALAGSFSPIVDGDIVSDYSSKLLAQGKFTKKPYLIGTNTDEGTLFTSTTSASSRSDAGIEASLRASGLDANTTTILMQLYPNVNSLGLPAAYMTPSPNVAPQYKRAIALATDQSFLRYRRARTDAWSKAGVPVYSYLFDVVRANAAVTLGATHFAEIGYVFYNTLGVGYPPAISPLTNTTQPYLDVAQLMCRMWVSFIHDLDPNNHAVPRVQKWPVYNATDGYGENFYFHLNSSGTQPDTFRLAQTTFINSVAESQYGR